MDELTLGLAGAGVVVIGGVVLYNMFQAAKMRRRMPRPMPDEAADALVRQEGDEAQFIEPVRHSTLAGQTSAAAVEPAAENAAAPVADVASAERREPTIAPVTGHAEAARVEPTFGGLSNETASSEGPTDAVEAAAVAGAAGVIAAAAESHLATEALEPPLASQDDIEPAGAAAAHEAATIEATVAPVAPVQTATAAQPAAATISTTVPGVIDRRIDCVVPIRVAASVAADKILPAAQRLRRAGNKPVFIEGKTEVGQWELLQNGSRYEELRAAAQLANRNGPLNELEFSEFVSGVQQFADSFDGEPEFPDMMEIVGMARELDGFAAQCDAQLSLNVMSDGAPWSANYVQAVASQDGLLLSRDGTRFVKLDARQNPVFMLQFGDTNFLRDDLTYKGGNMITLVLDVPVADEDILPFRLMCDYAKSLSARIGARVVDDSRRTLPESQLHAIEEQLLKLYARLEAAGIPAGSSVTRRLFSQ